MRRNSWIQDGVNSTKGRDIFIGYSETFKISLSVRNDDISGGLLIRQRVYENI